MEALSIITIPEYMRKTMKKKLIGSGVDYRRFNVKSEKVLDEIFWIRAHAAADTDNSNVVFDGQITYQKIRSPRGNAHIASVVIEGVGSVPVFMLEIYGKGQGLQGAIARIDFYGGYFRFRDILPEKIIKVEEMLIKKSLDKTTSHLVRQTRIDIAYDFAIKFPQNGSKWITPSKNSMRSVDIHRTNNLYNSYGYLAEKNSGYGVRIYDKVVETEKHRKRNWYGGDDNMPENWTRIEFEFYSPYSSSYEDFELFKFTATRLIGDNENIALGMIWRPPCGFKVENAYNYFKRYAKMHGITLEKLLEEVYDYNQYIEEKKNFYGLVDE